MQTFFADVWEQIQSYYAILVGLMPKLGLGLILFIGIWLLASQLQGFFKNRLKARMEDPLLADFLARAIKIAFVIFGFLVFLRVVGLGGAASSILAGAGVSAFIIGFAFKDIGENFLAGLLMAFKRPFRIGDIVETGDIQGKIVGLTLRDTQIKTFDGKDVYVPNGMIMKNPIINYTIDGFLRLEFDIGLDYESDLKSADGIMMGALDRVDGILRGERGPVVAVKELAASTVNFTVYFWINTFDKKVSGLRVRTEAMEEVVDALVKAGFYLPADIIELKNYADRELRTNFDQRQRPTNGERESQASEK